MTHFLNIKYNSHDVKVHSFFESVWQVATQVNCINFGNKEILELIPFHHEYRLHLIAVREMGA